MIQNRPQTCLFALVAVLLLGGCAGTLGNPLAVEKIQSLKPGESRVILSVGASYGCFGSSTSLAIRPYHGNFFSRGASVLVDHLFTRSDFPDEQGTLSAVALPPGKYKASTIAMQPNVVARTVPRFVFTVGPDENLYIGNFFMPQSCGMENRVQFNDRSQRDLALLAQRNPLLARSVTTRIAQFDGYAVGGDRVAGAMSATQTPTAPLPGRPPVGPGPTSTTGSLGPFARSGAAPVIISESFPATAAPLPPSGADQNFASHYSEYLDQVTTEVQSRTRSILLTQIDKVAERDRAGFSASFDRSIERSSTYIRDRVLRILTASFTQDELAGRATVTVEREDEARRRVQQSEYDWSLTLVRSAWIGACTQAGPSATRDCSGYLSQVEEDLSRLAYSPQ